MKKVPQFFIASLLAIILAGVMFFKVHNFHKEFEKMVDISLKTTDGYDQEFIDMVNRLEDELALRASFGYIGEKDPMTGQRRSIVKQTAPKKIQKEAPNGRAVQTEPQPVAKPDPFRLSAIIYDDKESEYTAIMNIGERSVAIEIGDMVQGRKIRAISKVQVQMVDGEYLYLYGIEGTFYKESLTKDRGSK